MASVEPYLTPAEAAARLTRAGIPVSEDTVRRWAKSGRLPSAKLPFGRVRFRPEDIDALASTSSDVA
jgi:excisionase family DNA binding protein